MFPDLQDYGLIFISLAVFGFIILDIYNTGKYWSIPDFYKSNIEKFFHYISIAILVLSFSLVIIGWVITASNQGNIITESVKEFFYTFKKMYEIGIISEESYIASLKIYIFASYVAVVYIIAYIFIFLFGLFIHYLRTIQLNVFLVGKSEPIKFAGLLSESDDFFYFLKMGGINLWEAIRKDDISRIETVHAPSQYENWNDNFIVGCIAKYHNLRRRFSKKKPS